MCCGVLKRRDTQIMSLWIDKPMLTQGDIERVLTRYDLGTIRGVRAAAHGIVNETAFAETSGGRYVVRRNQRRLGKTSLELRHRLLAWLRTRGFPAPRLIPSSSGDTAVEVDGRIYEIFTYIESDDFNADRAAHMAGAGSILASYHRAVADFPHPPDQGPPRYNPVSLFSLNERLLQRDVMGELTEQLSWYDRRSIDLSRRLPDEAYRQLPHLLIHGDVHRDNFLFRGDMVVALIDFDQVSIDARLVDLADALVGLAVGPPPLNWSPWGVYQGPLDVDHAIQLLRGYENKLPLSAREREALPLLVEVVWLQGNLRRVLLTSDADPDYHIEVLEQGRWLSKWLAEHKGAIFSS